MKEAVHIGTILEIQEAASSYAHYGLPGVYGNFVWLDRIQEVDGTCTWKDNK